MRLCLLVNKLGSAYRGGVNSFCKYFQRMQIHDFSVRSLNEDRSFLPSSGSADESVFLRRPLYILSDLHVYEDDELRQRLDTIARIGGTVLAYIHGPDSLKEGDRWVLDHIDGFLYDRPALMQWFDEQFLTYGKWRHELTLPFIPDDNDDEITTHVRGNIVCSFGRIIDFKGMQDLIYNSHRIKGVVVLFGYLGGHSPKQETVLLHSKMMVHANAASKSNISYMSAPYGLPPCEVNAILRISKTFVDNLKYPIDGVYGVQYTALEAMAAGCIPIVSKSIACEFERQRFKHVVIEDDNGLVRNINGTFLGSWFLVRKNNHDIIVKKQEIFLRQLNEIRRIWS